MRNKKARFVDEITGEILTGKPGTHPYIKRCKDINEAESYSKTVKAEIAIDQKKYQ